MKRLVARGRALGAALAPGFQMRSLASKLVIGTFAAGAWTACHSGPPPDEAANPAARDTPAPTDTLAKPTFADFSERIDAYMKERAGAEDSVPELKETSDPKKVHDREK